MRQQERRSMRRFIKNALLLAIAGALLVAILGESADATTLSGQRDFQVSAISELNTTGTKPATCSATPQRKIEKSEPLGPLYEIAEPNLLELFMKRLKSMQENGSYDQKFNANKALIGDLLQNPPPVKGLQKSTQERTWLLTASIPESLPDELLRKAQEVELPRISRELLFIDGTDPVSIECARSLASELQDMRVVLTAGSPSEVSKQLNRRIFFDQGGGLVRVFGIKAVPTLLFNSSEGAAGLEFPVTDSELVLHQYFSSTTR